MAKILQDLKIETEGPRIWNINNKSQDIHEIDDLKLRIRDLAVSRLWNKLSQSRHNFQGLDQGRDEAMCAEMAKIYKDKQKENKWQCIQADGIFTPWRAHQRNGTDPKCPKCGNEIADAEHLPRVCGKN